MNKLTKLMVLFLAIVMMLSTFAACDREDDPKDTDTETETETEGDQTSGTESDSESETTTGFFSESFNGEVIHVLGWRSGNITEYVEELTDSSTVVEQAVYNRCDYTETRLNIKTTWEIHENSGFVDYADRENANGGKFDVITNTSTYSQTLMTRGVLSNLKKYPYLDFESDGWAKSLLTDVTVGNKLYFATGDISTNLIFMTSVVFFNKDLVKDLEINQKIQEKYNANDLYELVTSGKWTLDKMLTLCEDTYHDTNNDGLKNRGDRFGFNTYQQLLENFYYGGGYTTIKATGSEFSVSEDYLNAEIVGNLLEQVNDFLHDSKDGFYESAASNPFTYVAQEFAAGNVLFSQAPASHAYTTHSNTEDLNYSVLPIPKHTETQEAYACTQSFPYAMYSIASQSKYASIASAFLQVFAEESYEVTRPALFDKMMKGRYAEDPEDAEMWEYAVDANVFDVGRIFQSLFKSETDEVNMTVNLFRKRVIDNNDNWSNVLSSYAITLATRAATLASDIQALPD